MASNRDKANDNYDLLYKYYFDRQEFITRWKKCEDFRVHQQWTAKESADLKKKGMIDYEINRIRPAYRNLIAQIMARRPNIKITSVRGINSIVVTEFQRLLYYIWSNSEGLAESRRMLTSYFDSGLGIFQVYEDPSADFGRGELLIREVSPDYIYLPKSASGVQFDDAQNMFYGKYIDIEEALATYGHIRGINKDVLLKQSDSSMPLMAQSEHIGPDQESVDKGLEGDLPFGVEGIVFLHERYKKVKKAHRLVQVQINAIDKVELFLVPNDTDLDAYLKEREIEDFNELDSVETKVGRVNKQTCLGQDVFVSEEELPIDTFPFGFCVGEDTRNPNPVGDVWFNIGQQKMINHLHSLISLIGQSVGIPHREVKKGAFSDSAHKNEIQANMGNPTYIPEYDIPDNQPIGNWVQTSTVPGIPPILGDLLQLNMSQIDFSTGRFPMNMGDPSGAPNTAFGVGKIMEAGDVTTSIPLTAMQICFKRVFNILAQWVPNFYTLPKYFEIVEGTRTIDGRINELTEIGDSYADITSLRAKVEVDVGSHMSQSKLVAQMIYKELAAVNPLFIELLIMNDDNIDEEEKKAILAKMQIIPQLQQELQQSQEVISQLSDALGELNEDNLHEKERTHITRLRGILSQIKAVEEVKSQQRIEQTTGGNGENKK